jgi:hypothetical protein
LRGVHGDSAAAYWPFKLHLTVDQSEEGEISADTDSRAGIKLIAALADDDSAWLNDLTAVHLDAAIFGLAVSTITGRTLSFFVCHL